MCFLVLATANFNTRKHGEHLLKSIRKRYPDAPLAVMEFWTGWFDVWGREHHTTDSQGETFLTAHTCCHV